MMFSESRLPQFEITPHRHDCADRAPLQEGRGGIA
jgi:hypothetical protein